MEHDARGRAFSELLVEVFRLNGLLIAAGDELVRPVGLTSARWQVLGVVDHGPRGVSEIARTMGLARQSVRETAEALARDGLVVFQANPRHRRAKLVAITEAGRAALAYAEEQQVQWANRTAAASTLRSLQGAVATLRGLSGRLDDLGGEADGDAAGSAARAPAP
ncbi:MarR family transcriptional regulator [Conexibacter stalactiti]|uniref:MarR family transcriptional regulator n=1 Tax=Conexibacter stalactiti TaxID=1940611 RepID=A0ABU4HLB7_9ACTN|nr:MarR family transcriptional regulator [Conexibacter stalactiti]MDW5594111.1 MarR family transcriptional regulator [Conexibacter stalactiti]MEC5034753.1 MarR family transcriptional regulator [Conexibacter stalactiti]